MSPVPTLPYMSDDSHAKIYASTFRKRRRLLPSQNDAESTSEEGKAHLKANTAPPTSSRIKPLSKSLPSNDAPVSQKTVIRNGKIVDANSSFATLEVAPWLIASLAAMAIERPTAIQKGCIPEILAGRDVIGGSKTGSGKTVAFAVPILHKWAEDPMGVFAVVLTPTR